MTCIKILTTGGTIAMQHDASQAGAIPTLSAADLTDALPLESLGAVSLEAEEIVSLPSSHFTLETLWMIRQRVATQLSKPDIDAVVITHGTDVMEETAMLLDLTLDSAKPIVLTGAMRTVTQTGYDGLANLAAAVRVAASRDARGLGVLVVMNEQVHAARFVTKTHTLGLDSFRSPSWGPLGRIEGDRVIIGASVTPRYISCPELEPRVDLLKLTVGAQPTLLEALLKRDVRGIVIEALGGGRIPPWWFPTIRQAVDQGITIAVTSRCPSGRVWDPYGYTGAVRDAVAAGSLLSEGLNGQKARIKLMVVLGAAQRPDDIERLWYDVERV
jgi:L-asparaginase